MFADIDPSTLTLDPRGRGIRHHAAHLRDRRRSCLWHRVRCGGLGTLAARRGLKLIYDAAHAFGTTHNGRPLASFGDASMLSFHATKLFHTAEGGALIVGDPVTKANVDLQRNFGIASETEVVLPGINAKMSELSAALGLSVLPHLAGERQRRARVAAVYDREFSPVPGVTPVRPSPASTDRVQYYVIRVDPAAAGCTRDDLYAGLKRFNVHTRRYFWPLCSDFRHIGNSPAQRRRVCPSRTAPPARCCACRCTAP